MGGAETQELSGIVSDCRRRTVGDEEEEQTVRRRNKALMKAVS